MNRARSRVGQDLIMAKACIKCGVALIEGENWYPWAKRDRCYQCKECIRKRQRSVQYRQSVNKRRQYKSVRISILNLLGGKCAQCGFSDIRALQIDHINGGGRRERKAFGTNMRRYYTSVLEKIKKGDKSYRCLCANCNCLARYQINRRV